MNYTLKLISLCFVVALVFNSCDNKQKLDVKVANQVVTLSNLATISSDLKQFASDEEIELFINSITRLGNTPDSILGKTVAQLIEGQRNYYREELEKTLIGSGTRIELFLNHSFHYYGIQFLDEDPNQPKNNIIFDVTNRSDREIKRVEGNLSFYDPQGRLVRVFQMATGMPIPAEKGGKTLRFQMSFVHNVKTADTLIRTRSDMQAVWTPKFIEFTDGTILEDITLKDFGK